jgi:diadenosine tetraphosphate (Ap4A) HIT family hydrolase
MLLDRRAAVERNLLAHIDYDASVPCPFCALGDTPLVHESPLVVAFRDRFPVTEGHTLIVPRRHVETYFDATSEEQAEIWLAVLAVRRELDAALAPDGYNVGFNAGAAAGQTVMHLHVHVIPRRHGDVEDPRGGVRGVIPAKQKYVVRDSAVPEWRGRGAELSVGEGLRRLCGLY